MKTSSHLVAIILLTTLPTAFGAASFAGSSKATRVTKTASREPAKLSTVPSRDADWTRLARAVGQAEENRDQVIAQLRSIKNLRSLLLEALPTPRRSLALDVMSALEMHGLVNELMVYMSADEDGFVTLTINSLLDQKNQDDVLKNYGDNLAAENISRFSAATIVAMLEPVGRLGVSLTTPTLQLLASHKSAEVRGAALYYLRMMALSHHHHEQDGLVKGFLKNTEFQIRLQAVSTMAEFSRSRDPAFSNGMTLEDLLAQCKKEKSDTVRQYCSSLVEKPKGQR